MRAEPSFDLQLFRVESTARFPFQPSQCLQLPKQFALAVGVLAPPTCFHRLCRRCWMRGSESTLRRERGRTESCPHH